MKAFLFILAFPLSSIAQYMPNQKSDVKVKLVTDSGIVKGYFIHDADSSVLVSPTRKYDEHTVFYVPVNTMKELRLKNKSETGVAVGSGVFVLGFILTAGLTKNAGDFDNDGKTSFFELILTAIEGTTSSNRRRRNTALIVGGAGGTAALLAFLFSNKKLSLTFPLTNRNRFYTEKRGQISSYTKF